MDKITTEYDTTKTWGGLPSPHGWQQVDLVHHHPDGAVCGFMWERLDGQRITVIEDVTTKADGRTWLHVSVGKPNRKLPTYEDLAVVRKLFIGEHRECYQVFPTKDRYVNFGQVLHLFCCLDAPEGVLPHFEGQTSMGLSV